MREIKPIFYPFSMLRKSSIFLFFILLIIFITNNTPSVAQTKCENAPCASAPGGNGPSPCQAKQYCSNSDKINDGTVQCTPSADTDGCGVDASIPTAPSGALSMFLNNTSPDACYAPGDYVQWIWYYLPKGINTVDLQGSGKVDSWIVYRSTDGTCNTSKFVFVECSNKNQWKEVADVTANLNTKNKYFIALIYKKTSQGTISFKTKDCRTKCAPYLKCPDPITVECGTDVDAAYNNWVKTAQYEACGGSLKVYLEGKKYNCGKTYVATYVFELVVNGSIFSTCKSTISVVDTKKPTFNEALPSDMTAECDNIPTPPKLTASDDCDSWVDVKYVQDPPTFTGCKGSIKRTWTAIDDCGNSTQHVQIITVQDTKKPVFNEMLPGDLTVECNKVPAPPTLTAKDNCDTWVEVKYIQEPPTYSGCKGTIKRTWTAVDDCGNTAQHVQTITFQDTQKPKFNEMLPGDITVECDAIPIALKLTASDDCDSWVEVKYVQSPTNFTDCKGAITRTWTATDDCGNTAQHIQKITVQDTKKPYFTYVPPYAEVCSEYDIPLPGTPKAEDNCDKYVGITYNGEYKEFDPNCKFIIKRIRTWTATDDCGNTATATQVIAVKYPPYSGGWAKADKYEFCNAWGNESVNLTVWNYSGDIVRWEMDLGCKGNWVAIPNTAGKASITVVPPSPKDDSECGVCYRAVIGNCAGCGYVYSEKAYVKPDVPAKGGKIVLKKDMMSNYYAICPGENIYLKLSGYVGRIIKWQYTTANSGSWYDIPNSAGQTELYVEGDNISTTTYYRAIICSICGVCLPPFYTDYSHVFTLQKRNSCSSMWNTPGTGAPNFDLTLLRVYPAPALDRVTLEINGVTEGVANIEIVDIAGKVMLNNKQAVVQGFNEVKVDISRLSSGLYILRFTDSNNKRVTTKVNKQ